MKSLRLDPIRRITAITLFCLILTAGYATFSADYGANQAENAISEIEKHLKDLKNMNDDHSPLSRSERAKIKKHFYSPTNSLDSHSDFDKSKHTDSSSSSHKTHSHRQEGDHASPHNDEPESDNDEDAKNSDLVNPDEWDNIVKDVSNIDCPHKSFYTKHDKIKAEHDLDDVESLCDADLRKGMLNPMGRINVFPKKVYNYINQQVYLPLGYSVQSQTTFSELIKDAIFLSDDDSRISGDMMLPHNREYKNNILEAFKNIEHYSTNFEDNKPQISDAILDLLKKFHIYWNVKRHRNEMDQVKENTLDIIKEIIKQYRRSQNNMKLTALNILHNIKDAYFRFFRADKLLEVLKDKPVEQLTVQILRRYKDNVDKIRMHQSSYNLMITEIGYLLELSLGFWRVNYMNGIVDKQNVERFRFAVIDKIKEIYADYQKYMIETGDSTYNDVKDFTVIFLGKLEVKIHRIFNVFTFRGYLNIPKVPVETQLYSAAELYFRLMDQLVVVPERCLDMHVNDLKECLSAEITNILNNFYYDYWMFTSVNGAQLFDFIKVGVGAILEALELAHNWDNAINWKNQYFAELFKFDEQFRQKYYIRKVYELDDLMNQMGYIIERQKGLQVMAQNRFKLLDKLDTDIYDLFVKLKSDYNQYDPLNKHIDILNKIKERIHNFLQEFVSKFPGHIDKRTRHLMNDLSRSVETWYRQHCVKYVVNTSPNNKITALDQLVPVPSQPGTVTQQVFHEPVVMSGATYPTGMGFMGQPENLTPDESGGIAENNGMIPEIDGGNTDKPDGNQMGMMHMRE